VAVSVSAALDGQADMAVGNVVGSNIFNCLLFILGISALIVPLVVNRQLIRQEVPIMFGASLLMLALASNGNLAQWEAGLLLGLLLVYTGFLVVQSRRESAAAGAAQAGQGDEFADELQPSAPGAWDAKLPVPTGADCRRAGAAGAGFRLAGDRCRGVCQGAGRE
jgi:cation:H+ antiporter